MFGLHEAIFVFVAIMTGLIHGCDEGMSHIMPMDSNYNQLSKAAGVRAHKDHGVYHIVSGLEVAALIRLGMLLGYGWWNWYVLAGSLFLLWQATETGIAVARQNRLVYMLNGNIPYEMINFYDLYDRILTGWQVYALTAVRVIAGAYLIIAGG